MSNNIVLIQCTHVTKAVTIRYLAGILRSKGYHPTLITIDPIKEGGGGTRIHHNKLSISPAMIHTIIHHCHNALYIGFTSFSCDEHVMHKIYSALKNKGIQTPIVVGGPHATLDPVQVSFHSDFVCIGDGEKGLIELAEALKNTTQGKPQFHNIFASSYLQDNSEKASHIVGSECVLDGQSFPDYTFESEYFINKNGNHRITQQNAHHFMNTYSTFFSRGCIYNCTFCAHETLSRKSNFTNRIKHKKIHAFINELKTIRTHHPWAQKVTLYDPNILSNNKDVLVRILSAYKRYTALPFRITGFTFAQINEITFKKFLDAGMLHCTFGIESITERTRKLFNRKDTVQKIKETDSFLFRLKKDYLFDVHYEIILDIPWETREDSLHAMEFLSTLRGYDYLLFFSLKFTAGTKLLELAKKGTLTVLTNSDITHHHKESYCGIQPTYINFLFLLLRDGFLHYKCMRTFITHRIPVFLIEHMLATRFGQYLFNTYNATLGNWIISFKMRKIEFKKILRENNLYTACKVSFNRLYKLVSS